MAKQKKPAKLIAMLGNPSEIANALANFYELNPEVEVIDKYVTQSVRQVKQTSSILSPGQQQPQFEPITVIYIAYYNPTDLVFSQETAPAPEVKANLKAVN